MNIAGWLIHTVTIAEQTGTDVYGDPTIGSQSAIKARVESTNKLVRGPAGEERQADHRFVTLAEVRMTHRIWLPGDSTADAKLAKRPIKIDSATDKGGRVTHYQVWL